MFDAVGQNDVEEYTLNAENRIYCDALVQHAGAQDFDWFEGETTKHLELVCRERPGLEPGRSREGETVSCVVRVDQNGFACVADPRHSERAIQELGLTTARPQLSLGGAKAQDVDEATELGTEAKPKTYDS